MLRRNPLVLAAALVCACATSPPPPAGHGTDALLLSCMDYRLTDDTTRHFDRRGLRDRYDHVALAGAALAVVTEARPAWSQAFWEHLDVALQLHHVHQVILLDHRDCGAYRVLLGEDLAANPERETQVHAETLRAAKRAITEKYPELEVETLLMALDGSVETIR